MNIYTCIYAYKHIYMSSFKDLLIYIFLLLIYIYRIYIQYIEYIYSYICNLIYIYIYRVKVKCNFNCYSSTFTILSTLSSLNSFVVTTMYIYTYIYSIVFLDVGMPLLESKLLSLLLNPVEIGPSNTSPG